MNELYDSLLYLTDMNYALNVAELIYTKVRLDDDEFINGMSCHFYANKRNMV